MWLETYTTYKHFNFVIILLFTLICCNHNGIFSEITVNIVVFYESSSFSEYVDSSLMSVVDFVSSDCWIAVWGNPNSSKIVWVNLIVDKLS